MERKNLYVLFLSITAIFTYCLGMTDTHILPKWLYTLGMVAVEFEKPECVSKVRFLPRNDDNFIREGEVYQLFYWNGFSWKQVEETTGNYDGILHIENVPTNALLLLHNATRGVEERIFTYEKGEQVWW